jgi:hypothetical protein
LEHAAGFGQAARVGHHQPDERAEGAPAGRCLTAGVGAGWGRAHRSRMGCVRTGWVGADCRRTGWGRTGCGRTGWGGLHHEPPEVAWLPPELEIGEEPELKPLEPFEFELEPFELEPFELELEPFELELELFELEPDEEEPEFTDEPEPELVDVEPDDAEDVAVLCVDPGKARATAPAATTLAMVTAVVAERTLARPRSRSATAWRMLSRCALLMCPTLRSRTQGCLQESSRLAMR